MRWGSFWEQNRREWRREMERDIGGRGKREEEEMKKKKRGEEKRSEEKKR